MYLKHLFCKSAAVGSVLLLCTAILAVILAAPSYGQNATHTFFQQVSFTGGKSHTLPLWLTANQYGITPAYKPSSNIRLGSVSKFTPDGPFTFELGTDLIARIEDSPTLFFHQLYGEATWGPFLLRLGRKRETAGEVHPDLSVGSMIVSPNAAPVAGISLSWPEYVAIPGTKTFVAIKGHFKQGLIEGYRITTRPILHSKSFYIRLGQDWWWIKGWGGIQHHTIWGGKHRNPNIGDLPNTFEDFLRVVFLMSARENTAVAGEVINALGNSVGSYDFGITLQTPTYLLRAYRHFYLEDTVGYRFRNGWDGIWGLGFTFTKKGLVDDVLYEHVNTKRQGSRPGELMGTDNYYNHFLYSSGWTHRGRARGIPIILTEPGQTGVVNNILLAHHLGLGGQLTPHTRYKFLFTFTRNYGANSLYQDVFFGFNEEGARYEKARHQYYAGLTVHHTLPAASSFTLFSRLAFDWGKVRPDNNWGITLGVAHKGLLW